MNESATSIGLEVLPEADGRCRKQMAKKRHKRDSQQHEGRTCIINVSSPTDLVSSEK